MKDTVAFVHPEKPDTYGKRKLMDTEDPHGAKTIFVTNPRKINRDKYNRVLFNMHEKKRYSIVYDKRVILKNLDTLPFGF